ATRPEASRCAVGLVLGDVPRDAYVLADADRVMQVLTNLLSNAAKFSPPHAEVVLGAERRGPELRVWVSGGGPGIPKDFRERIFQRFAQADSSTTRRREGTGLGLSISKAIIERLGGRMGVGAGGGRWAGAGPHHQQGCHRAAGRPQRVRDAGGRRHDVLHRPARGGVRAGRGRPVVTGRPLERILLVGGEPDGEG